MSGRVIVLLLGLSLFVHIPVHSQPRRWDGEAGDSLWSNPMNWEGNVLPTSSDDVVLDNSLYIQTYTVKLPEGTASVTLRSLVLSTSESFAITLLIPSVNKAAPALSTLASPGIQIGKGATLINASGASSGNAIAVGDSLRILDGGRFVQRSETAHATLLGRLASGAGTSKGIIEFDVPGGASYTVSISNRIYGSLIFSSASAGVQKNYLSSGSGPLQVRGDCVVSSGAVWSLNFSGICSIVGNVSVAGTWNLSSGVSSNVVKLSGDFQCSGKVTESGTGMPVLEWMGTIPQHINVAGSIQNSIAVNINNLAGVTLQSPLTLRGKLMLTRGILYSSADQILMLDTGCVVQADSLANNVFIHGPVCRKGLSSQQVAFFPVGKGNTQRWIALKALTGNVIVEYVKEDPSQLSSVKGEGISHISGIEYWKITPSEPTQTFAELSFDQVNSGGVSDLSSLRVASLVNGKWEDRGNTAVTGTAGTRGSVMSDNLLLAGAQIHYFTLASSLADVNTLPNDRIDLHVRSEQGAVWIEGKVIGSRVFTRWQIECMRNNEGPTVIRSGEDAKGLQKISFAYTSPLNGKTLFRAVLFTPEGNTLYGKWVPYQPSSDRGIIFQTFPNPAGRRLFIKVDAATGGPMLLRVMGFDGKEYYSSRTEVQEGLNTKEIALPSLLRGVYWVSAVLNGDHRMASILISQ